MKVEDIEGFVANISVFSPVLPLAIAGILIARKRLDKNMWPIVVMLVVSLFSDQFAKWLAKTYQNNMPASHLWGFLSALISFWFFCLIMPKSKRLIMVLGISFLVLYTINSTFNETIFTFNAQAKVVQGLCFIVMAFWYFFDVYRSEDIPALEKNGIFWAVVAIFIYYSGALFTQLLYTRIVSSMNGVWIVHNLFNITKNLLFGVALWTSRTH